MVREPDSSVAWERTGHSRSVFGVWNMEIPVQKLELQGWNGM